MLKKIGNYDRLTPWIFLFGFVLLYLGARFPTLSWIGIDWASFFSNLGLYVTFVVFLQWYYDKRTKDELVVSVIETALSNTNIVRSGIADFSQDTKKIEYRYLLSHADEIIIGFLHSSRLVDDNYSSLKERAMSGKKTTILLSDPEGNAIKYLLTLSTINEHIKPDIKKVIARIENQINQLEGVKKKIDIKYHDTVLRYSFVHSKEGVWIKFYRNSTGTVETPGIYVRSGSPLYDFYFQDIQTLKEKSKNV